MVTWVPVKEVGIRRGSSHRANQAGAVTGSLFAPPHVCVDAGSGRITQQQQRLFGFYCTSSSWCSALLLLRVLSPLQPQVSAGGGAGDSRRCRHAESLGTAPRLPPSCASNGGMGFWEEACFLFKEVVALRGALCKQALGCAGLETATSTQVLLKIPNPHWVPLDSATDH